MRLVLLALVLSLAPARAATLLDDSARVDAGVTSLVHDAAVLALTGQPGALDEVARRFERLDEERRDRDLAPLGLSDDVRLLGAGLRASRDARRDALEAVLDADPDPVVRRFAEHALEQEDDAAAADGLLSDDRHNRRATVVNEAVRPLGVFSGAAFLAAASPFLIAGSALDSLLTTAVNLYHYNDLSPREREALVRYRRQLARDPDTADASEIAAIARRIGARRAKALCTDTVAAARRALDDEDLERARYYVGCADRLDDCAERAAKARERLAQMLARREAREEAMRWPADEARRPTSAERADYEALATSTALANPGRMMEDAQRFLARHPESALADSATVAIAVARDLAGYREEARTTLDEIAGDDNGPARTAAAMLATSRFQRLDSLAAAERRHARDVAQYVLIGGALDGRTALYTAAQLGTQTVQAAESFGIFNVIGLVTRAWSAWRRDPASNQAIIDEGEEFLAREPGAPEGSEVHERLAIAYERAGIYDRALLHYRAVTEPEAKRIEALEGKVADRLLQNAEQAGGEPALLAALVHYYPETDAAEKAREALAKLPGPGDIPLSRDALARNPSLLGPSGLDLAPTLFDGEVANGELADAGVTVSPGTLALKLENPDGGDDRTEQRVLEPETYTRARAAAEAVLYETMLTTDRDDGEVGTFERFVPFFVNGSLGETGVSVAPGIKLRRDRSDDRALYE